MRARQPALFSSSIALVTAVVAIAGCNPHVLQKVELDSTAVVENVLQLQVNKDVDILFVIDNSGSMEQEQITLGNNFASFIGVLEDPDVDANYRIGVTTTDNGNANCATSGINDTTPEGGKIRAQSCTTREIEFEWPHSGPTVQAYADACVALCPENVGDALSIVPTPTALDPEPVARPWIQSIEGITNIEGGCGPGEDPASTGCVDMVQAFQCIGPQGVDGCGFESQLESQWKALELSKQAASDQYGFLRDQAVLAIVHVTDEADCSANTAVDQLVFDPSQSTSPFWNATVPNSSICWNAGTKCTGSGAPFDDCVSQSYNYLGNEIGEDFDSNNPDDQQQVLLPLKRYTDQLTGIEMDKATLNGPDEAIVSIIGGVPEGFSTGAATLTYQNAGDPSVQEQFGVDFGCSSVVNGEAQDAVPPVRLREFAEAFYSPVEGYTSNLFSICADDYAPALEAVADAIAAKIKPGCFENCVRDVDEATPGLQVQCKLTQDIPEGSGTITKNIPNCADQPLPNNVGVCYELRTGDELDPVCAMDGFNVEFALQRDPAQPVPGGTVVNANCQLSDRPNEDCPGL